MLLVPRSCLASYGDRGFSITAPRLWNSLPENLREIHNIFIFQQQLKTHLFTLAFPNTWEFPLFHLDRRLWMIFTPALVRLYKCCVIIIILIEDMIFWHSIKHWLCKRNYFNSFTAANQTRNTGVNPFSFSYNPLSHHQGRFKALSKLSCKASGATFWSKRHIPLRSTM